MDCDRIAASYFWLESAAFGGRLQQRRLAFLNAATGKRRALLLGDGDGRFLQALARAYPELEIDSIDSSLKMLSIARQRIPQRTGIRLIHGDALTYHFPANCYDLIVTHFFLDCFMAAELGTLVGRIAETATTPATWIISEFRRAPQGWRRIYTGTWLAAMYGFFHMVTGLQTRSLTEHADLLSAAGFLKREEWVSRDGLLNSECWQRS